MRRMLQLLAFVALTGTGIVLASPVEGASSAPNCDDKCKDMHSCMLSFANEICSRPPLSPCTTLQCSVD